MKFLDVLLRNPNCHVIAIVAPPIYHHLRILHLDIDHSFLHNSPAMHATTANLCVPMRKTARHMHTKFGDSAACEYYCYLTHTVVTLLP